MGNIIIAPSMLACNFAEIGLECSRMADAKADWLHLDVMDGIFVPNISFGVPVVASIRKSSSLFLDVHLMIVRPDQYIEAFHKAGADAISIHVEASEDVKRDLEKISELGMKSSIAINPDTPISSILPHLPYCHHVCLMSVYPGFGGQQFIENSLSKIATLKKCISDQQLHTLIEVDGGVTIENANAIISAGADILVAGNTVFKSSNAAQTIATLRSFS